MDKLKDILINLAGHEEMPPAPLFDKIMEQVLPGAAGEPLTAALQKLQVDHAETSLQQYDAIRRALFENNNKKQGSLLLNQKKYWAAAAVLFGLIAAWFAFQPEQQPIDTAQNRPEQSSKDSVMATQLKADSSIHTRAKTQKQHNEKYSNPISAENGSIGTLTVRDNDILSSLMNTDYAFFTKYYQGNNKKMVLDIDQYSSATVSDKMLGFMKTLYSTNRRQKPTYKARRAKRILNKWKKTDANYFDSANSKIAIDIMDLTEFLIEKRKQ